MDTSMTLLTILAIAALFLAPEDGLTQPRPTSIWTHRAPLCLDKIDEPNLSCTWDRSAPLVNARHSLGQGATPPSEINFQQGDSRVSTKGEHLLVGAASGSILGGVVMYLFHTDFCGDWECTPGLGASVLTGAALGLFVGALSGWAVYIARYREL